MIELADTSAWLWSRRSGSPEVREQFDARLVDGFVAVCDVVRLELLFSARNRDAYAEISSGLDAMPSCPLGRREWARALSVYEALAAAGVRHRAIGQAALLVAAAAESAGVPVLHRNAAFERIAAVTRQPVRTLA